MLAVLTAAYAGQTADDAQQRPTTALPASVAQSFTETGNQHLAAGRYQQAADDFAAALAFEPSSVPAKEGLALATAKLNTPDIEPEKNADALLKLQQADMSARGALHAADYARAEKEYERLLIEIAKQEPTAGVAAMKSDAEQGLKLAREGLKNQQKTAYAPPAPVEEPLSAAEKAAAPEAEYKAAIDEAMKEVTRLMRPQTEILSTPQTSELEKMRRSKNTSSSLISRPSFQSVEDEEAEQLIKAKLLKRVSINFKDQPFEQAVDYIRAASDLNIVIDPTILPTTKPVSFNVVNMEMRYVLDWILRFQQLEYRIRHGAIFISNDGGLAEKPCTMMHDIDDLTINVRDFNNQRAKDIVSTDRARPSIFDMGLRESSEDVATFERSRQGEEWARFIRNNISSSSWSSEGGVGQNTIAYRNGKLVVTHTPEVQEQIRELLSSFRKARAIQVAILARFIEINEDFLEDLSVEWSGLEVAGETDTFGIVDTDTGDPGGTFTRARVINAHEVPLGSRYLDAEGLTLKAGFLKGWQVEAILTAVRKQQTGNILTAPRVTCFNTQRAFLTVSVLENFIRTYDSEGTPDIGQVNTGIVLEVQPFVSADRRYITIEIIPQANELLSFDEVTYTQPGEGGAVGSYTVQLPRVSTRQVMTTVSVPDGGTLLIGGLAKAREARGFSTVPILGDIPIIKWFFSSRRKIDSRDNLILLVTAHIIQQEED